MKTLAKTPEGKAISSRNNWKGGERPLMRELSRRLKEQQQLLKEMV